MSNHATLAGTIRKLWPTETDKFRDHLLRLDKESRRLRFGHGVSDSFIQEYAAHATEHGAVLFGYFEDGVMRATAELRKVGDAWGQEAEAAFSVEPGYQEKGLGTQLMGSVIRAARNRGVHLLFMRCLAGNAKMRTIARKHEAELRFDSGDIVGEIIPQEPNCYSFLAEAVDDRVGHMLAVLTQREFSNAVTAR